LIRLALFKVCALQLLSSSGLKFAADSPFSAALLLIANETQAVEQAAQISANTSLARSLASS